MHQLATLKARGILHLCTATQAQNISMHKQAASDAAEVLADEIRHMATAMRDCPETSLRGIQSAELLIRILEHDGFAIERGVAGMPNAF